jgi:hypothetical protein
LTWTPMAILVWLIKCHPLRHHQHHARGKKPTRTVKKPLPLNLVD